MNDTHELNYPSASDITGGEQRRLYVRERDGSREYKASELNIPGIAHFAKRVARETTNPLQAPLKIRVKEKKMVKEIRQSFFGLRKQLVEIEKEIEIDKEIVGKHWLLNQDNRHLERTWKSRIGSQIQHMVEGWDERYHLILLPNGKVMEIVISEEYLMRDWQMIRNKQEAVIHELDAALVKRYDRKKVRYEYKERERHNNALCVTMGNAHQAGPIIRHAKGVGISLLLKALLKTS